MIKLCSNSVDQFAIEILSYVDLWDENKFDLNEDISDQHKHELIESPEWFRNLWAESEGRKIPSSHIYIHYKNFCECNGMKPLPNNKLRLNQKLKTYRTKTSRGYILEAV